jgi:hypothetical protein
MVESDNPLEVAKIVANDIKNQLVGNHLSTVTYNLPTKEDYSQGKGKIPIFVVVSKFNTDVATKMANVATKWKESRIDGPFIAEQNDFKGIEDSVPEELWDISSNYAVLEGTDILKQLPKFNKEYLRAQAERTIRGYIFKLRWTLPQALMDESELKTYINNLAFYSQLSIQLYHKIAHPEIRSVKGHLLAFSSGFPESWQYLKGLLEMVYDNKPVGKESVDLLTNTINFVLVGILNRIDTMGR